MPQGSTGGLPPHIAAAGAQLSVDVMTVEIVAALAERGIHSIVLKGPSIAGWLYETKLERPYEDADILMSPVLIEEAEEIMAARGFTTEHLIPLDQPWYARTWTRADGSIVELHRTLWGIGVPPEETWEVLADRKQSMSLAKGSVDVLDVPARAMHVALHAAQHGPRPKSLDDLRRALEKLPREVWDEAARLARKLDALGPFAAGLHLMPDGRSLGAAMRLPTSGSIEVQMRVKGAPRAALTLGWIASERRWSRRLRMIWHKVFPPADFVREKHAGGRAGALALIGGYARRLVWLARRLRPALKTFNDARRSSAGDDVRGSR